MKGKLKMYAVLLSVLVLATIPLLVYAADGQIKIAQTPSTTFPIVIDKPGSYVLTSNIEMVSGNGIKINTDNVTLDLNGHALISQSPGGTGISGNADNRHNIIIENGTVTGFWTGVEIVYGANISGIQIKNMNVSDNGDGGGIFVTNAIISNCTANNNGNSGIRCSYSTVTNCTANNNNQNSGILVSASTVTNCIASGNHAFTAGIQGSNSIITHCIATGNDYSGILAQDDCQVESNNTRGNGRYGLYLPGSRNFAIKNTASGNASGNFYSSSPANNYMPTTGDNANMGW